jgi:beta-lactamase class A
MTDRGAARKIDWRRRLASAIALSAAALAMASMPQPGGAQPQSRPAPLLPNVYGNPVSARPVSEGSEAQRALAARVRVIGQSFNGDIGIAVRDVESGWTSAYDGDTFFPQQSVSKFWVALTALAKADRGELSLDSPVTLTRSDLTLFHQPVAQQIGANGYTSTVGDLMFRALTQSDNTCNDAVLRRAGGPDAVRAFLRDRNISGIRFGPGERLLQSAIAGLEWKQSLASGNAFYTARNAVPAGVRRAAFEHYIADPMDGATPLGVVSALARLKRGELLSPSSTQRLLSTMSNTKTGPQRLKGGLEAGWHLAHKTGTGQVLGGVQAGYNDIGVITAPDGHSYAVAVLIRRTAAPLGERMSAMQNVVRAVISYHASATGYRGDDYSSESLSGSR